MENVDTKEDYNFKMLQKNQNGKAKNCFRNFLNALLLNTARQRAYTPFCYSPAVESESKCNVCNKNYPELIYYHSDDDTWIASGNE